MDSQNKVHPLLKEIGMDRLLSELIESVEHALESSIQTDNSYLVNLISDLGQARQRYRNRYDGEEEWTSSQDTSNL